MFGVATSTPSRWSLSPSLLGPREIIFAGPASIRATVGNLRTEVATSACGRNGRHEVLYVPPGLVPGALQYLLVVAAVRLGASNRTAVKVSSPAAKC
jgi:hypothetical protein